MKKIFLGLILALNLGVLWFAGSIAYKSFFTVDMEKISRDVTKNVRQKNKDSAKSVEKKEEKAPVTRQNNQAAEQKAKSQVKEKKPIIKRSAKFIVISEPSAAKVFVNGYFKGRTPTEVEVVSAKENTTYKLILLKAGYKRWEKDVIISRGDVRRYRAVLHESD